MAPDLRCRPTRLTTGLPFTAALTRPVPIAELELARARHHLAWLAEALRVSGLEAYGLRVLKLAFGLNMESAESVDALERWLRRNVSLRWGTSRVGVVTRAQAEVCPVARWPGPQETTATHAAWTRPTTARLRARGPRGGGRARALAPARRGGAPVTAACEALGGSRIDPFRSGGGPARPHRSRRAPSAGLVALLPGAAGRHGVGRRGDHGREPRHRRRRAGGT